MVLESVYGIERPEILDAVNALVLMPILELEAPSAILSFVAFAREAKGDLSDLLTAHSAKFSGCEGVLILDKRTSRIDFFELLKQ